MRGYGFNEARTRAKEALIEVGVPEEYWGRTTWGLSGGYRRRVLLVAILGMDADIVFLDEPSIGLDPLARRELWTKISLLREKGKTILLTTHYMEEAETLSDHIIIIHNGRVLKEGSPKVLTQEFPWRYKIEVTSKCEKSVMENIGKVIGSSPPYIIYLNEDVSQPLECLAGYKCKAIATFTGLEDVFLSLVGEEKWVLVGE